jgi:hypothetical protein
MNNTIQQIKPSFTYESEKSIPPINCIRFNSSGSLLATGSRQKVKLFNISGDSIIPFVEDLQPSFNNILSVAFNPSGTILAVGSEDNIKLYNILYEQKSITELAIPELAINKENYNSVRCVRSVSFDSTGNYLAFSFKNNSIIFWKISYDSPGIEIVNIATFSKMDAYFSSVMFQPNTDPPLLVASSHTNIMYFQISSQDKKTWKVTNISNKLIGTGHINCIDFYQGANKSLLATVTDYDLKLFDCSNALEIDELVSVKVNSQENLSRCISVAFHPSELFIVTGCWDNSAKLWRISPDFRGLTCIADLSRGNAKSGVNVAFYPRKNPLLIATGGTYDDTTIKLFNIPIRVNQSAGYKNNETRFFKLVSINGKEFDGGRYELPAKTKSGKAQTRGPKDKASIAFSEICKKNNKKGECSYKFAIQETTRGSNKKVYHYEGKRVKLAKQIVLELKDKKTGEVKKVVKKYKNVIVATH